MRIRILELTRLLTLLSISACLTAGAGAQPPTYLTQWGSSGSGDGQFDGPQDVAVDASGNAYVVDLGNFRIQKFTGNGSYLTQWGTYGTGNGQFVEPFGVATDTGGNIYVADSASNRIQKFSSTGTYLTQWGSTGSGNGQFSLPRGIAADAAGNVFVADTDNHRIQKFTSTGTYLTQWGTAGSGNGQFASPVRVAVDAGGNVYVADHFNSRIQKFTSSGAYITQWGTPGSGNAQFSEPTGVAIDASGNVYVADEHDRIQKFTSTGTYLTQWGSYGIESGHFNYPIGVAVDAGGNVYVADHGGRVQKFTPYSPPIEWVSIGNPANDCDTQGPFCFGGVNDFYKISKFEVTNAQYAAFLNAKAASDPLALYHTNMGSGIGGITRSGSAGSYAYSAIAGREDMPVTYVSFYDTLRFVNWLNNAQGSGDTETGAYTLLGGTAIPSNGLTVTRNAGARVFLPSEEEWYKAAYHDPASGGFFDYPAGSDTQTTCAAPGATTNTANCISGVGNLTPAGSYTGAASPYGTFDQGGNVWEWNEAIIDGPNRGIRGGTYVSDPNLLAASARNLFNASSVNFNVGFRVAATALNIEWRQIGNLGNPAGTASHCFAANCGSVAYAYDISKTEVTNAQYVEFLNAVDPDGADALALYNASMASDANNGGISFVAGNPAGSKYASKPGFADKPVNYVGFYDAMRFANWLNNGQGAADTETGAYTITPSGISSNTITREGSANTFLPSENEWYKAAYYSPGGVYFAYPAGSHSPTACDVATATANRANCDPLGVGAVTGVGSYTGSASPYGTFDQGGNVWEWNEQPDGSYRGIRGGGWSLGAGNLAASYRFSADPLGEYNDSGFRIARRSPACSDGIDNDGDGRIDHPSDPGCASAQNDSERSAALVCDDGLDGDGDTLIDHPSDPGCKDPSFGIENPLCNDGLDNDLDSLIDMADADCGNPWSDNESPRGGCGLLGIEVLPVLLLATARRRRRRAPASDATEGSLDRADT